MRIALAGNPNSGKTTMYNALTGQNEKVGNWAGVTVDKKEHSLKKSFNTLNEEVVLVDLPGAYSISPFTKEESVTSDFVKNQNADVIINIVDATNLNRSLFFTTQLSELGVPLVVALNKTDLNEKKNNKIDSEALSGILNCPVIKTVSTSSDGLEELVKSAINRKGEKQTAIFNENIVLTDKTQALKSDKNRFKFVGDIVRIVETKSFQSNQKNFQDKIDAVLVNKWLGLPIFALVMYFVFWVSQAGPGVWIADYLTTVLEKGQGFLGSLISGADEFLYALLIDGVIGGVIAVIGFLPLVMVMYFLIALLEDCGYMARASVVLDPIFKRVGLSGKSIIPFVVTTGCAVPGVMATRTIRDEKERRATALLAPFMPCGAKLPVIALFAGAFFRDAHWVGAFMYFVGIILIFFGALLVNKITGSKVKKSYFIMELPEYKVPGFVRAFKSMCSRGWSYVVKAATVILICNTLVQIMQSFTLNLTVAETANDSILAAVSEPLAYLLVPVTGVLSWQLTAAAVTGFIAKENVVGTLAVCFAGLNNLIDAEELVLLEGTGSEAASVFAITKSAALAYLMFNLFSPPCFAAIGAMNSEMKNKKWLMGSLALQLGVGYSLGFFVYQIGTLITTGSLGNGFWGGLIAVAVFIVALAYLVIKGTKFFQNKSNSELTKKR